MYLFYSLFATLHTSNDYLVHHQDFINLLYLLLRLEPSSNRKAEQLGRFAWFVQSCRYSKLWTPDDERNGRSKHVELQKDCRINTYKMCILLVCL